MMTRFHLIVRNMGLQTRISILVSFCLVTVIGVFAFLSIRTVQDTSARIVHERLVVTEMTATYVDTLLRGALNELGKATTFAPFDPEAGDLSEERHVMAHTYGRLGNFTQGIMLINRQGLVVAAQPADVAPVGNDLSVNTFIRKALETGQPNVSNSFLNNLTNKPTVAVAYPVRNENGELISLLCGLIDLTSPEFANSLVHATHLGRTGHADIIDGNGNVVASSDPGHVLHSGEHPEFYIRMLEKRISGVETAAYVEDGQFEGNHVMAFVPIQSASWGVGLGGTEEETFGAVLQMEIQAIILAVLSLLAALVLVWFTTKKIVRPIETLITVSEHMASGDLASPIKFERGDEVGRLATTFDRMRLQLQNAHHALTVEKSQYQGIFRSMANPVFTVDADLRITSINPAAERLIGLPASEVMGLKCGEVLQSPDRDGNPNCRLTCPLTPGTNHQCSPVISREVVCTRQGDRVTVEITRAPIFDDVGQLVGVVHLLRDISAQEELDQMKDQFISNVSHELRSPLGHIKGYATTLLRPDAQWDEKTRQKFIGEILYGSEKLQRLVDELLDMSRLEAGRFAIEKQPVQVGYIARAAAKWVRSQSKKHKVDVNMPRGLPMVIADPLRLEQVLRNLLENAVKYSPEGGCVRLEAHEADGNVVVSVADEGIGIPEEQITRVFERFHRVDSSLASQVSGVGLGLSICQKIVEAHGGRIWVESVLGKGSIFRFSIPLLALAKDQEKSGHGKKRRNGNRENEPNTEDGPTKGETTREGAVTGGKT